MKTKWLGFFFVSVLIASVFLSAIFSSLVYAQTAPDVYVGVDIAYGDVAETEALIDQISSYTNLIVFGCTGVTYNITKLNETCQYAYDRGMSFIIYDPPWNAYIGYPNRTGIWKLEFKS